MFLFGSLSNLVLGCRGGGFCVFFFPVLFRLVGGGGYPLETRNLWMKGIWRIIPGLVG